MTATDPKQTVMIQEIKLSKADSSNIRGGRGLAHEFTVLLILTLAGVLILSDSNAENQSDYSHVDSRDKAEELAKKGELFKILLFPAEFGGQDVPPITVYVPAGIPEIKDQITQTLIRYVQDGLIDNMAVNPEYKGNSFVPSKIVMETSHSGKPGQFNPTIEIW